MGRLKAHPTLTDDELSIPAVSPLIQICYSGLSCMLAQCVDLGFWLSETGHKANKTVTFRPWKQPSQLKKVHGVFIKCIPIISRRIFLLQQTKLFQTLSSSVLVPSKIALEIVMSVKRRRKKSHTPFTNQCCLVVSPVLLHVPLVLI